MYILINSKIRESNIDSNKNIDHKVAYRHDYHLNYDLHHKQLNNVLRDCYCDCQPVVLFHSVSHVPNSANCSGCNAVDPYAKILEQT